MLCIPVPPALFLTSWTSGLDLIVNHDGRRNRTIATLFLGLNLAQQYDSQYDLQLSTWATSSPMIRLSSTNSGHGYDEHRDYEQQESWP